MVPLVLGAVNTGVDERVDDHAEYERAKGHENLKGDPRQRFLDAS
jgi:hypothetical protein